VEWQKVNLDFGKPQKWFHPTKNAFSSPYGFSLPDWPKGFVFFGRQMKGNEIGGGGNERWLKRGGEETTFLDGLTKCINQE
jgi:hypothetical protein